MRLNDINLVDSVDIVLVDLYISVGYVLVNVLDSF